MSPAMFEIRLGGGYRMFWSTITPSVSGCLDVLAAPDFCRSFVDAGFSRKASGHWDLWPFENPARPNPLELSEQLCRPVQITNRTLGVALISLQYDDDHNHPWFWVELFLSTLEPAHGGRSVFEDWVEITRSNKDDVNKDIVLRLSLGDIKPGDVTCFKSRKKLVTSDLFLEIRPRRVPRES